MKYLLTLLFLASFVAYGQEPPYTPMRLNYQFRGIKVDSLFLIPSFADTTAANSSTMKNVAGAMIRTGNDFWMRNSTINAWLQNVNVGPGASNAIDLQGVTDNGDTTTNPITFYNPIPLGYDGSVKIGVDQIGMDIGSLVGVYGDTIDANPHSIELLAFKGISDNYFRMRANSSDFVITNTYQNNTLFSNTPLSINTNGGLFNYAMDDITLDADSNLYLLADQNITIDSAENISIQANNNLTIDADNQFFLESNELYIKGSNFIEIDISANTPVIIGPSASPAERGYLLQNKTDSVDLDAATYSCLIPGVFRVWQGNTYDFGFPDAPEWPGQMVIVINRSGLTIDLTASHNIYDRGTGNLITQMAADEMGTFYSDGSNWYGFIQ